MSHTNQETVKEHLQPAEEWGLLEHFTAHQAAHLVCGLDPYLVTRWALRRDEIKRLVALENLFWQAVLTGTLPSTITDEMRAQRRVDGALIAREEIATYVARKQIDSAFEF